MARRSVKPTAGAARGALGEVFETAAYAVRLPYDDDAHALVSELHDRATVRDIGYGERVTATVTLPADRVAELERRVAGVGGGCERVD